MMRYSLSSLTRSAQGIPGFITRMIVRLFLVRFAIMGVAILTLAVPVSSCRAGRQPVPELDLVKGGPPIEISPRLWIDTDAACGAGPKVDPDDCFALALLFHSEDIQIAGISTVFGNSDLPTVEVTLPLWNVSQGNEIMLRLFPVEQAGFFQTPWG
jgi:hypothetical protein